MLIGLAYRHRVSRDILHLSNIVPVDCKCPDPGISPAQIFEELVLKP